MQENYDSSNINLEWLNNIYDELKVIQNIERLSREGCNSIMEYLNVPISDRDIIIPDTQYKNIKLLAVELDILTTNLLPILNSKYNQYKEQLDSIFKSIYNRNLFLEEVTRNNQLVSIKILPTFYTTIKYLIQIKSDLISDIGHLLYLKDEDKPTW